MGDILSHDQGNGIGDLLGGGEGVGVALAGDGNPADRGKGDVTAGVVGICEGCGVFTADGIILHGVSHIEAHIRAGKARDYSMFSHLVQHPVVAVLSRMSLDPLHIVVCLDGLAPIG